MESKEAAKQSQETTTAVVKKDRKIVVAIDDSEGSFYALTWTTENFISSLGFGDLNPDPATLVLVHVQQPFQQYMFPAGPAIYATPSVLDSVKKAQEQASAVIIARALAICKERLIKAETLILDGDPKEMICHAVEQIHADLLVVGSRGLGKFKRTFLGSVSDYCAHHAKCPILIVKPPK